MHNNNTEETAGIPEITTEELQTAINKLKKGKSPDSKRIRAEDIKACDDETREMVRQIFNEIIKKNEFTPEDWKKLTIKVIHKKVDVENVSNYRPICSLPALYKLFSTMLYGRLYPVLDQKQAEDQAGFRKSYQTTNHLAVQHGSSILTEGRNSTMAKEKRNGYIPERPRSRLHHKLEICRRRDAVRNIQRTDTENVV